MQTTRLGDAREYDAPRHHGMTALRLQSSDSTGATTTSVGLSHFLPGGGAELSASGVERIYIVVTGEVTVTTDDGDTTLGPLDSCVIAPGELRAVENRTTLPASMLVVMPQSH